MPEINRSISFDTGIEQIVDFTDPNPAQLPDSGQYVPGEGSYQQQINEVLFPPSVEHSLLESFRPSVQQRQLLTPSGYNAAHTDCRNDLQHAIEKFGDRPEGEKLRNVADLLANSAELTNLLNTYRHLLHQA